MNRLTVAALGALFLTSFLATALFSQDKPVPTRLGFIDVKKAFDDYRKKQDVEESFKAKTDTIAKEFRQRDAAIDTENEKLNTLNKDSDERLALERQIQVERYALDYDRKAATRDLQAEVRRSMARIYREISNEARNYGQEKGLAAVLLYSPLDADFEKNEDLQLFMATRTVICRDDVLDVTTEIVGRLNSLLPPPPKKPAPDAPKDPTPPKDGK